MSNTAVLEKILNVKENEKRDAQAKKIKAVEYFEKKATELYQVLKTKETAEQKFQIVMRENATITTIREQSNYISLVNQKINELQQHVQKARMVMEEKQEAFTDAHVEVKKIEKLIEIREKEQQELIQKQEMLQMDEISLRQFQKQTQNR